MSPTRARGDGPPDVERTVADGWRVELASDARRIDDGRTVIGGAPLRVLRLTEPGARFVDRLAAPGGLEPATVGERALAGRLVDAGLAVLRPGGPVPFGPDDLTVVIPVRDDLSGLLRTLPTVGRCGEVIVVDDGSSDPITRTHLGVAATSLDAEIRFVRSEVSFGPSGARQLGIEALDLDVGDGGAAGTRPALVAFVDADVELRADWLTSLIAHFADEQVAAVAPRIRSRAGSAPPVLAAYEDARSSLDLGPDAAIVRPGTRVSYVPTTALVVRRAALDDIGGFDTTRSVGEDVDLVWRLHDAGWSVRFDPSVEATHPARPTVGAWLRQRYRYGTSAAELARRHGDAVAPLAIGGWSAAAWASVLLGHPVVGAVIGAGTTAALVPKLSAVDRPVATALDLAGSGNLRAGRAAARAVWRPWWPVAVALAVVHPRSRPAVLTSAVVPAWLEHRERRPTLGLAPWLALCLADDIAYGTGVWAGCIRARSARALLPRFANGRIETPQAPG